MLSGFGVLVRGAFGVCTGPVEDVDRVYHGASGKGVAFDVYS